LVSFPSKSTHCLEEKSIALHESLELQISLASIYVPAALIVVVRADKDQLIIGVVVQLRVSAVEESPSRSGTLK
jgi:hypothetical protein